MTTQKQLRREFWLLHPAASRRKVADWNGGKMYVADTRMAFNEYVDACVRSGEITPKLARKATL